MSRIRAALPGVQIMCTIPVLGADAVSDARRYEDVADFLLLDTMDPATSVVGATGQTHDWDVSAAVVTAVHTPVVLAGGLGPDNVTAAAVARVRPAGVDSETHTSRADDRRRKDPERVRAFVRAARARVS